jgi:hypothetical protein
MQASPRAVCPLCVSPIVHFMPVASKIADVDYFMCGDCLHIWNVPKHRDEPIQFVTDRRVDQRRKS